MWSIKRNTLSCLLFYEAFINLFGWIWSHSCALITAWVCVCPWRWISQTHCFVTTSLKSVSHMVMWAFESWLLTFPQCWAFPRYSVFTGLSPNKGLSLRAGGYFEGNLPWLVLLAEFLCNNLELKFLNPSPAFSATGSFHPQCAVMAG